jgi:hypothetical protein
MSFIDLPIETLSSVFKFLNADAEGAHTLDTLNAMYTCKRLFSTGLPILYHEVILRDISAARAFFDVAPKYGRLVRRFRLETKCPSRPRPGVTPCAFSDHVHILDTLLKIKKFCPNLRALFLWKNWCLEDFIVTRPQNGESDITAQLLPLEQLYLFNTRILRDHDLHTFARVSPKLRELRLSATGPVFITTNGLIDCFKQLSLVQVLYLDSIRFYHPFEYGSEIRLAPQHTDSHLDATATLLETFAIYNRRLEILSITNCGFPRRFPKITKNTFPYLRIVDLTESERYNPPNITNEPLVTFLNNLYCLQELHLESYQITDDSDVLICDLLPSSVRTYTRNFDIATPAMTKSIQHGRLVFSNEQPVVVEDEFVKG